MHPSDDPGPCRSLSPPSSPHHFRCAGRIIDATPARFKAKTFLKVPTIDVLSFGELALIAAPRTGSGQFSLSLDEDGGQANAAIRHFLRVRRGDDGSIDFAGLAADVQAFGRGGVKSLFRKDEWRQSGFRAELFAGILIGVAADNP